MHLYHSACAVVIGEQAGLYAVEAAVSVAPNLVVVEEFVVAAGVCSHPRLSVSDWYFVLLRLNFSGDHCTVVAVVFAAAVVVHALHEVSDEG